VNDGKKENQIVLIFLNGATALNKSFQNRKLVKICRLNFVLPQINIRNLSLSCLMLSHPWGEALRN